MIIVRDISQVFAAPNGDILFVSQKFRVPRKAEAFAFNFDIAVPQRLQWKWYDFIQPIVYCRLNEKTRMFWDWLQYEMDHKYIPIEAVIRDMLTSAESAYWTDVVNLRVVLLPSEFGSE